MCVRNTLLETGRDCAIVDSQCSPSSALATLLDAPYTVQAEPLRLLTPDGPFCIRSAVQNMVLGVDGLDAERIAALVARAADRLHVKVYAGAARADGSGAMPLKVRSVNRTMLALDVVDGSLAAGQFIDVRWRAFLCVVF